MKTFTIAFATVLTGCLAATAQATVPARKVYQQVVRYGDLNLESEADAAILLGRIKSAARKVCGLSQMPIPIEIKSHLHACVEDATARAVADVNAPTLTRHGQLVVRNTIASNE